MRAQPRCRQVRNSGSIVQALMGNASGSTMSGSIESWMKLVRLARKWMLCALRLLREARNAPRPLKEGQ